jgi:hypothetical protein
MRIRKLIQMVAAVLVLVLVADDIPDILATCSSRKVIIVELEIGRRLLYLQMLGGGRQRVALVIC